MAQQPRALTDMTSAAVTGMRNVSPRPGALAERVCSTTGAGSLLGKENALK